jgi:hypothetical protein
MTGQLFLKNKMRIKHMMQGLVVDPFTNRRFSSVPCSNVSLLPRCQVKTVDWLKRQSYESLRGFYRKFYGKQIFYEGFNISRMNYTKCLIFFRIFKFVWCLCKTSLSCVKLCGIGKICQYTLYFHFVILSLSSHKLDIPPLPGPHPQPTWLDISTCHISPFPSSFRPKCFLLTYWYCISWTGSTDSIMQNICHVQYVNH